nr:Sec-independent translocase component C [Galdieria sulphuraria]
MFYPKMNMINDKEMPLAEHFVELRERLLKSLIFILVSIITIFFNIQYIIKIIQKPAEGIKFIQLAPGEYFFSTVKISIYLGLIISIPYILYEILQFTIPAMTIKERQLILPLSIISAILFFGGIIFAYFVLLSPALKFFISYGANIIEPIWSFEYYFNFVILLLLLTGIAFQIPIFEIVLAIFGLISSNQLIYYWRYVVFFTTILSAVLTPSTDPLTQILMSTAIFCLYFLGVIVLKCMNK